MSFARLRRNGLRCATVLACLAGAYLVTSCGGQSSRLPATAIPSNVPTVATANATPTVALKATSAATPPPCTAVPPTSTAAAVRASPTNDEDALGDLLERVVQELEDEVEGDDALADLDDVLR